MGAERLKQEPGAVWACWASGSQGGRRAKQNTGHSPHDHPKAEPRPRPEVHEGRRLQPEV